MLRRKVVFSLLAIEGEAEVASRRERKERGKCETKGHGWGIRRVHITRITDGCSQVVFGSSTSTLDTDLPKVCLRAHFIDCVPRNDISLA